MPIDSIEHNSYAGDTQAIIRQRLDLVMAEISSNKSAWDFNSAFNSCKKLLSLSKAFNDYIDEMKHKRVAELNQHNSITLSSLEINTRINNILLQNGILTFSQLVELLDSGVHLGGLGYKSLKVLIDKVESYGIKIYTVNDDLKFIFNFFDIKGDVSALNRSYEVTKKLKISQNSFGLNLGRQELQHFIDQQAQIAQEFIDKSSRKSDNTSSLLSLLRKDDESIYLIIQYFFITINRDNPCLAY